MKKDKDKILKRVIFKLNEEEQLKLKKLAYFNLMNVSEYLRYLINYHYENDFPSQQFKLQSSDTSSNLEVDLVINPDKNIINELKGIKNNNSLFNKKIKQE